MLRKIPSGLTPLNKIGTSNTALTQNFLRNFSQNITNTPPINNNAQPSAHDRKIGLVFTTHPTSPIDFKKLVELFGQINAKELKSVDEVRSYVKDYTSRIDKSAHFKRPSFIDETMLFLSLLRNMMVGFHALDVKEADRIDQHFSRPGTWAVRDNDRSSLHYSDMIHGFALQIQHVCNTYLILAEKAGLTDVISALKEALAIGKTLEQTCQAFKDRYISESDFDNIISEQAKSAALRDLEQTIQAIAQNSDAEAFARTFSKFKLNGAYGEVRVDGTEITDEENITPRIFKIAAEIKLLKSLYDDPQTMVIANFSQIQQISNLKKILADHQIEGVTIIPLIESAQTLEWLLQNAQTIKNARLKTIMFAGSDYGREVGPIKAVIDHERLKGYVEQHDFTLYYGTGTSIMRSGDGLSPTFGAIRKTLDFPKSSTMAIRTSQPMESFYAYATPDIALQSLQQIIDHHFSRPIDVSADMVEENQRLFASIMRHEQEVRQNSGSYADFCRRNSILLEVRNIFTYSGARDKEKYSWRSLYDDRAIQVDNIENFFRIPSGTAWARLNDQDLKKMIAGANAALANGNPVTHKILYKLAALSIDLNFADACHTVWKAARFDIINDLEKARRQRIDFLRECGFSLENNLKVQKIAMEIYGRSQDFIDNIERNKNIIKSEIDSSIENTIKVIRYAQRNYSQDNDSFNRLLERSRGYAMMSLRKGYKS